MNGDRMETRQTVITITSCKDCPHKAGTFEDEYDEWRCSLTAKVIPVIRPENVTYQHYDGAYELAKPFPNFCPLIKNCN